MQLLTVGLWDRRELAIALEGLATRAQVVSVSDRETARETLADSEVLPDLILLTQPLPGTYEQHEIEELRRAAPLAPIVVVAGTWCEGELRTGRPLAGVLRMYWYELVTWWQTVGHRSGWSLGLDGCFSPRRCVAPTAIALSAPVAIHTPTLASFEALSDSLKYSSIRCLWCRATSDLPSRLSAGIWDGGQLESQELLLLRDFAEAVQKGNGSLVVLLDFPREEHYARLRRLGCHAIFSKPYIVDELVTALARLT